MSLCVVVSVNVALRAQAASTDWPQWRGPERNGISRDTGLLREWPRTGPAVVWSASQLGAGYGSVAVAGDRVFVQGMKNRQSMVTSLDRASGKPVWSIALGAAQDRRVPVDPAVDDGRGRGGQRQRRHRDAVAKADGHHVDVAPRAGDLRRAELGQLEGLVASLPDSRVRDQLALVASFDSSADPADVARVTGTSGHAAESVPFAIWLAGWGEANGLVEAVLAAARAGGDTDSIASITGQILGTRLGFAGLPIDLVTRLVDVDELQLLARRFTAVSRRAA